MMMAFVPLLFLFMLIALMVFLTPGPLGRWPRNGYHYLPGRGKRFWIVHTLWRGPDHLLAVAATPASEDYRRFYFSDIQAIVIRKTASADIAKIVSLVAALPMAWFLVQDIREEEPLSFLWWIPLLLMLVIFLVQVFRGPTCVTHIQTPVQVEPLPSLNRLKEAEKVVRELMGPIGEAQRIQPPTPGDGDGERRP